MISDEIIHYLMEAGARAPSFYNCQPWRITSKERRIDVHIDPTADTTLYDWKNFHSLLGCGAVVENIAVAVAGRGLACEISVFPDLPDPLLAARIRIGESLSHHEDHASGRLEEAIWQRHTNTLPYQEDMPLGQAGQAIRDSASGFPGIQLHLLTEKADRQRVFEAVSLAEQVRFSRKDLHRQLHRLIRWSQEEAIRSPEGYTLESMGVCGFGELFFRITRHWPVMHLMNATGAYKDQARRANLGLLQSSAVGLLTVDSTDAKSLLLAGRVLERLWLEATAGKLDLQPHSVITVFHHAWRQAREKLFSPWEQQKLSAAFGRYYHAFPDADLESGRHKGVFLFRIGRGEAVRGYTHRKAAG